MRQRALAEHLAQLVRPPRPGLGDDVGGMRGEAAGVLPLEQEARDRLVEELVLGAGRPDQVVVDPPLRHRREDLPAGLPFAPAAVVDQQCPLGLRMKLPHLTEQLAPRRARKRLPGDHQRQVLPRCGQPRQLHLRRRRGGDADDAVGTLVPIEQLGFDRLQRLLIFVDGEEDGTGHDSPPDTAGALDRNSYSFEYTRPAPPRQGPFRGSFCTYSGDFEPRKAPCWTAG